MTAWLRLVPSWAWLAMAWALSLALVGGAQQVRVAFAQVEAATALTAAAKSATALADYKTEVSERDRKATLAALQETKRRMLASTEEQQNAEKQLEDARADVALADSALERLQQRLTAAERRSREAGNTITAQLSAATEAEARVRADLLGRVGEAAGLYADIADDRGIRGSSCERHYDSLGGG